MASGGATSSLGSFGPFGAMRTRQELTIEWDFTGADKTETVKVSPSGTDLIFHQNYSSGTAVILARGAPLTRGYHHYWELEMGSPIYGSAVMVGLGTKEVQVNAHTDVFAPVIGIDKKSWGYSHIGQLHHDCGHLAPAGYYQPPNARGVSHPRRYATDKSWKEGSIIGVYYDSWKRQVEFYHNRTPLGIAFTGLPKDVDLYPMVSATSAKTKMRLICSQKYPAKLAFECARALCKSKTNNSSPAYTEPYLEYTVPYLLYEKNNKYQHNLLMNKRHVAEWTKTLPPLLWRFINDNCWYFIGCKLDDLERDDEEMMAVPGLKGSFNRAAIEQNPMVIVSSDEESSAQKESKPKGQGVLSQIRQGNLKKLVLGTSSSSSSDEEGFEPVGPNVRRAAAAAATAAAVEGSEGTAGAAGRNVEDAELMEPASPSPDSLSELFPSSELAMTNSSEDEMLLYFRPTPSTSSGAAAKNPKKKLRLKKVSKVEKEEEPILDTLTPSSEMLTPSSEMLTPSSEMLTPSSQGGEKSSSKGGYRLRSSAKGKR